MFTTENIRKIKRKENRNQAESIVLRPRTVVDKHLGISYRFGYLSSNFGFFILIWVFLRHYFGNFSSAGHDVIVQAYVTSLMTSFYLLMTSFLLVNMLLETWHAHFI
jgi:hypothetical protein